MLTSHDDVVAVQLPDGGAVPVWGLGVRGAARNFLFGMVILGMGLAGIEYAARKRRETGWWSVRAAHVNPFSRLGTWFLLPASIGLMPMMMGLPWWQLWMGLFAVTARGRVS